MTDYEAWARFCSTTAEREVDEAEGRQVSLLSGLKLLRHEPDGEESPRAAGA